MGWVRTVRLRLTGSVSLRSTVRGAAGVAAGVGVGASLVLAISSVWVGAKPTYFRTADNGVAHGAYYVGLILLLVAWLVIGRQLLRVGSEVPAAWVRRTAVAWAVPLFVSVPIASRDVWAYIAQGDLVRHGLNPYQVGPNHLSTTFVDQLSDRWVGTPSPYGPLWLELSAGARWLGGGHLLVTVGLLRLAAAAGFVLLLYAIPRLARTFGARPEVAMWAMLANPLVLIDGVSGAHNDLLMLGLLAVALLAATQPAVAPAMVGAGLLIGAAAGIKIVAVLPLPFLVVAWSRARGAIRPAIRAEVAGLATAVAASALVFAVVDAFSDLGIGWLHQSTSHRHGGGTIGLVLMAAAAVACFVAAHYINPMDALAAAFAAIIVITPTVQPWYWCWALLPLAIGLRRRPAAALIAAGSVALVLITRPNGQTYHLGIELALTAVAVLSTGVIVVHRTRARPVAPIGDQ